MRGGGKKKVFSFSYYPASYLGPKREFFFFFNQSRLTRWRQRRGAPGGQRGSRGGSAFWTGLWWSLEANKSQTEGVSEERGKPNQSSRPGDAAPDKVTVHRGKCQSSEKSVPRRKRMSDEQTANRGGSWPELLTQHGQKTEGWWKILP